MRRGGREERRECGIKGVRMLRERGNMYNDLYGSALALYRLFYRI